jgi:site-specific DNA-methyltransferase (adenine-specific)
MRNIHINNDDNYATPPGFYNELNKRFNFDFDPCPYNEGEIINDGLKIEWGKSNFINPPYSRKLKEAFIKKGIDEMRKGKICVFLIPVSTSTKLFHEYIQPNATEIIFVKGRIKFGKIDNKGNFYFPLNAKGKTQSGTKDSMIVVFDGSKKI